MAFLYEATPTAFAAALADATAAMEDGEPTVLVSTDTGEVFDGTGVLAIRVPVPFVDKLDERLARTAETTRTLSGDDEGVGSYEHP